MPAARRRQLLASVDHAIAALTTVRGDLLLAERAASSWKASGDPTFEAWRGRTSRAGLREAGTEVRRAQTLGEIPAMRAAVDGGEVTLAHVDVVARTAALGSEGVRKALASPEEQARLLQLARRTDAGRFAKAAATWSATIDQAALQSSYQARRAARFVTVTDTAQGTRLSGLLDAMAGHRLRLALEAVAGKPGPDETRTRDQRWADALETIASVTLAAPPDADGAAGRRPHVSMVMTPETWAALRTAAGAARGTHAADPLGAAGAAGAASAAATVRDAPVPMGAPATLEDGAPVPPSELARTLCDCQLTRIVIDAEGDVLDLGRATRGYTPAQRRAVSARDRGCLWPGCGAAPRWCEVHHLVWWDRDGGRTAVLDGALACSFHHHEIHRLDLVVTRVDVPPGTGPDARAAAYVVTTPGGQLVADGRGRSADGTPVGRAIRTWTPGTGASDGAPARVSAALRPPPPRRPPVSVPAGSLPAWTSS